MDYFLATNLHCSPNQVLLLDPNGNLNLRPEMKDRLRKMAGESKNPMVKAHFLDISQQVEQEGLAICIGLSYSIIFEFFSNPKAVFGTFINCRKHLYGCLKVRKNL